MKRNIHVFTSAICLLVLLVLLNISINAQRMLVDDFRYVDIAVFSPDDKLVASGSTDDTLRVWEAATGKLLYEFPREDMWFEYITFLKGGDQILSLTRLGVVNIWDLKSGKHVRTFKVGNDGASASALLPDSKTLMTTHYNRKYRFWNITRGTLIRTLSEPGVNKPFHDEPDYCFEVSRDGKKYFSYGERSSITGHYSALLRVRDVRTGRVIKLIDRKQPGAKQYPDSVMNMALSADGRLGLTGDFRITLWDITSGKFLRAFGMKGERINSLAFSPDGKTAAAGTENRKGQRLPSTIKLWDLTTGELIREFIGHQGAVKSVVFSSDGTKILSGGYDGHTSPLKIWDVATGKRLQAFFVPGKDEDEAEKDIAKMRH